MTAPVTTAAIESAPVRGRVLMIARDYPPAATVAALRARGFARYLPEFGWDPTVLTVTAGFHAVADPSLLRPPHRRVYGAFAFDPKRALSLRGHYPGILAVPDRTASWLPAGVVQGLRAVRRERIHALLSTSPPATAHAIGLVLRRITKLPWVVDLRDPWSTMPATGLEGAVNLRLERRVIAAADRITTSTRGLAEDLRLRYCAAVSAKVHVVHNGFDEEDFRRLPPPNDTVSSFTVAHVGTIYAGQRHPGHLLAAVREALDRGALPRSMTVAFVGSGEFADSGALGQLVQDLGLEDIVRVIDQVSHDDALALMLRASALLLLQNGEFRACIPAKTFEYLRSGRPILSLAPADSETSRLLSGFTDVFTAAPNDRSEIAEKLVAAYQAWRREPLASCRERDLTGYTRRAAAAELAQVLDGLCEPAGAIVA